MPPSPSVRVQGDAIRRARRARVRGIRRRVVGGALALFVATWMLITLMLVTGHDPALARNAAKTASASTRSRTASTNTNASTGTGTTSTGTSGSAQSSSTSSLTSSQS